MAYSCKAVLNNSILTFYYDESSHSGEGTVYNVSNGGYSSSPEWSSQDITKAVIDQSCSSWSPTSLRRLFSDCSIMGEISGTEYLFRSGCVVTNISYMFYGCTSLQTIECSNWELSSVINMSYLFYDCKSLGVINASSWDLSSVVGMSYAFYGCELLSIIDVSSWNLSSLANIIYAFCGCRVLSTIDTSGWNLSGLTSLNFLFSGCSNLSSIGNVSAWDMSNISTMEYTFEKCGILDALSVSNWQMDSITSLSHAFDGCTSLSVLDAEAWNLGNCRNFKYTFSGCSSLPRFNTDMWGVADDVSLDLLYGKQTPEHNTEIDAVFKINGKAFKCPSSLKPKVSTLVSSSRNANGVVVGQKIGRDQYKLDAIEWNMLESEEWSAILKEFGDFYVTVTFWDMVSLTWKTIKMYPGDRSAEYPMSRSLYNKDGSPKVMLKCKVNIIDVGEQ